MDILITDCARSGTTLLLYLMKGFHGLHVVDDREVPPNQIHKYQKFDGPVVIKRPQSFANPDVDFGSSFWRKYIKTSFLHHYVETFKVLICIRDGRDVLTSRLLIKPDTYSYWVSPERWVKAVRRAIPLFSHANVLVMKYENLVMQPYVEIDRIAEFIELNYDNEWINHYYKDIPP